MSFPSAPFPDIVRESVPRTIAEIIGLATTSLRTQISQSPYVGEAIAKIPVQANDPSVDDISSIFEDVMEGKGYSVSRVAIVDGTYHFRIVWGTPYTRLYRLCTNPDLDEVAKCREIAQTLQRTTRDHSYLGSFYRFVSSKVRSCVETVLDNKRYMLLMLLGAGTAFALSKTHPQVTNRYVVSSVFGKLRLGVAPTSYDTLEW